MGKVIPIETRFWKYTDKRRADECWPWIGPHDRKGYGDLTTFGKRYRATHIALRIAGRPVGPGQVAAHSCDNPPCVNPAHLTVCSQGDNLRDGVARGRPIGKYPRSPETLERMRAGLRATFAPRIKTHCPQGHPYDEANTYKGRVGGRKCRECARQHDRLRYHATHPARRPRPDRA